MHHETAYYLALKLIKGIGPVTAAKLCQHFGSAKAIFSASIASLNRLKLPTATISQINQFDFARLDPLIQWQQQPNRAILSLADPLYPIQLKQSPWPPLILFVRGKVTLLTQPQLAIVGSRHPSFVGRKEAELFSRALSHSGLLVTSGLARGIDSQAHRSCLEAGFDTVAVLGTGIDRVYPPEHRELAHAIEKQGVLVSEYLPNSPATASSFPHRNRIIAGLSLGTLVIEAAAKSGSLITANYALEAGREVFAVPGAIGQQQKQGCHHLIQQGAKLTQHLEDVLEELQWQRELTADKAGMAACMELPKPALKSLPDDLASVLAVIDYQLTSFDEIVERSQLTVDALTNKLLLLELQGWVVNSTGGYTRR